MELFKFRQQHFLTDSFTNKEMVVRVKSMCQRKDAFSESQCILTETSVGEKIP